MPQARRKHTAPSLIERAANAFDFAAEVYPLQPPVAPEPEPEPEPELVLADEAAPDDALAEDFAPIDPDGTPAVSPLPDGIMPVDRERLEQGGYILPDGAATNTSEEFRIVKRRVLSAAFPGDGRTARDRGNFVLVNSAHPGDGKTWVAINLALSLAAEQDVEVLLVDADFAKPGICEALGLPVDGPGLMDALVDPQLAIEAMILRTEIPALSILPAGRPERHDTEVVAAARTRALLDRLDTTHHRRIVIFDSPPVLAASPATELACHVGQTVLVVRADRTSEAALRDAVNLLSGCRNIQLLLNRVKFSSSGRQFGSYYGTAD